MFAAISPTLAVANAALPSYVVTLLFFTGAELRPRVLLIANVVEPIHKGGHLCPGLLMMLRTFVLSYIVDSHHL